MAYYLIEVIDKIFLVYILMMMARILGSWVPEFSHTSFMRFIAYYTDPYLNLFRSIIPPLGMMDLSPIFALIALHFLERVIKSFVILLLA